MERAWSMAAAGTSGSSAAPAGPSGPKRTFQRLSVTYVTDGTVTVRPTEKSQKIMPPGEGETARRALSQHLNPAIYYSI